MLTYTDVSLDRTALARSGLPESMLAETGKLGFDHAGWIATTVSDGGGANSPVLLTSVHTACDRQSVASLLRTSAFDDVSFATLFEDGSVVETGLRPKKRWWYLRWGLDVPRVHAFALEYVEAGSIAALREIHETRVEAERRRGGRPVSGHDMRTYLAIRKRYRELADPRMQRQQTIALVSGMLAIAMSAAASAYVRKGVGPSALPMISNTAVAIGLSMLIGALVFMVSLFFVAPILARGAKAPPPRSARELLRLADDVRQGFLPPSSGTLEM